SSSFDLAASCRRPRERAGASAPARLFSMTRFTTERDELERLKALVLLQTQQLGAIIPGLTLLEADFPSDLQSLRRRAASLDERLDRAFGISRSDRHLLELVDAVTSTDVMLQVLDRMIEDGDGRPWSTKDAPTFAGVLQRLPWYTGPVER